MSAAAACAAMGSTDGRCDWRSSVSSTLISEALRFKDPDEAKVESRLNGLEVVVVSRASPGVGVLPDPSPDRAPSDSNEGRRDSFFKAGPVTMGAAMGTVW